MPSQTPRLTAASTVALAAVAGGHALVYELAPAAHELTHALAESGHQHWPLPWLAAALLAVGGGCAYGVAGARRTGASAWSTMWPRLACGQVAGFLLLEAGERVAAGIDPGLLLGEPVIIAGVLVQMAAAGLTAAVLRTGERFVRWLRQPERVVGAAVPGHLLPVGAAGAPSPPRPDRIGLTRRGPPVRC